MYSLLIAIFLISHLQAAPEVMLDTIVSVVSSAAGVETITQSDLDRPTLFGQYRSLADCEFEKAILLEAKKHKIDVDDAMVEAYLESVQQAYGMTRKEINQMFLDAGYTVAEGMEQLRTSQVMNIILQREVYENITVSLQEVRSYGEANPTYKQTEYIVERALIKKDASQYEQSHPSFSLPITLQESEISSSHSFIFNMQPGTTYYNDLSDGSIEVIKLEEKNEQRPLTFEERYNDIASMLQKEKYEKSFAQFKERLMKSVSIVHL